MNIVWAIVALVSLGIIAALLGLLRSGATGEDENNTNERISSSDQGCCGMHLTCERDSLLPAVSPKITYYDDEELNRYQGRTSMEYDETEVDEFREILVTLQEKEVAGWVRSLQLREIAIPEELKPEIFLIVGELRAYHMQHGPDA